MKSTKLDGRRTQHIGVLSDALAARDRRVDGDNGVPAPAEPSFDELVTEYERSKAAFKAARASMEAAAAAMIAAQCRTHFATTETESGYEALQLCTLERGHEGGHANSTIRGGEAA